MFRLVLVLLLLLIAAIAAIGYLVGRPSAGGAGSAVTSKQEVSIHVTAQKIMPAAEFISLHYRYTTVIKDVSSKEMFGIHIPGTEKRLLAVIDGTIKLGIQGKEIQIDTSRTDTLFIKFPPIKIISHEMHPETAEVYDYKNGLFNQYRASDHFALEAKQKADMELNIRANREIISEARSATEYAFKSFLLKLPALDTVPISFKWN
jgi:Na+-transporting methylmalonyl-CoA/oxaloacetate decarboxylase gamma subunit